MLYHITIECLLVQTILQESTPSNIVAHFDKNFQFIGLITAITVCALKNSSYFCEVSLQLSFHAGGFCRMTEGCVSHAIVKEPASHQINMERLPSLLNRS